MRNSTSKSKTPKKPAAKRSFVASKQPVPPPEREGVSDSMSSLSTDCSFDFLTRPKSTDPEDNEHDNESENGQSGSGSGSGSGSEGDDDNDDHDQPGPSNRPPKPGPSNRPPKPGPSNRPRASSPQPGPSNRPSPKAGPSRKSSVAANPRQSKTAAPSTTKATKKTSRKQAKPKRRRDHVLREIHLLKSTVHRLIPYAPFQRWVETEGEHGETFIWFVPLFVWFSFFRLVREILHNERSFGSHDDWRFTKDSLLALQDSAEAYIVQLLEDSYICTCHRGRVTLIHRDIVLARLLRRDIHF